MGIKKLIEHGNTCHYFRRLVGLWRCLYFRTAFGVEQVLWGKPFCFVFAKVGGAAYRAGSMRYSFPYTTISTFRVRVGNVSRLEAQKAFEKDADKNFQDNPKGEKRRTEKRVSKNHRHDKKALNMENFDLKSFALGFATFGIIAIIAFVRAVWNSDFNGKR